MTWFLNRIICFVVGHDRCSWVAISWTEFWGPENDEKAFSVLVSAKVRSCRRCDKVELNDVQEEIDQ